MRGNNQARVGHILAFPGFDITKAYPCPFGVTAITALPSSIFCAMYSGVRFAIPVPLALADDSISSVMIVRMFIAGVATRMIIF